MCTLCYYWPVVIGICTGADNKVQFPSYLRGNRNMLMGEGLVGWGVSARSGRDF